MKLALSQAIQGFTLEKEAQRLSPHTLADYGNAFRKLQAYLGTDPLLDQITVEQISQFLRDLGTKPQPHGGIVKRAPKTLSKKTILNIHTALSALWTWAQAEGVVEQHILHQIPRPKPEKRAINPFTQEDVRALLAACERSESYSRPGKRACTHARSTALRDVAIILLLLDTGMRASELCDLTIAQVDLKNHKARVFGKGSKERILPFSARTTKTLWKYLTTRDGAKENDRLFVTADERPYNRQALLQLLNSLGARAGVPDCHPHRFRHTFAITFLRNKGDAYTLQMLLGHSTMEMVKIYLQLAQSDVDQAHQQASPVANWNL